MDELYHKVVNAYKNAIDNDYVLDKYDALYVAEDMKEYDSDLEDIPLEEIEECIKEYRGY